MELGCQQVDFFKLGQSLSECTEFIGRHYLLIQLITAKGFRVFLKFKYDIHYGLFKAQGR